TAGGSLGSVSAYSSIKPSSRLIRPSWAGARLSEAILTVVTMPLAPVTSPQRNIGCGRAAGNHRRQAARVGQRLGNDGFKQCAARAATVGRRLGSHVRNLREYGAVFIVGKLLNDCQWLDRLQHGAASIQNVSACTSGVDDASESSRLRAPALRSLNFDKFAGQFLRDDQLHGLGKRH